MSALAPIGRAGRRTRLYAPPARLASRAVSPYGDLGAGRGGNMSAPPDATTGLPTPVNAPPTFQPPPGYSYGGKSGGRSMYESNPGTMDVFGTRGATMKFDADGTPTGTWGTHVPGTSIDAGSRRIGSVNYSALGGIQNFLASAGSPQERQARANYLRSLGVMPSVNGVGLDATMQPGAVFNSSGSFQTGESRAVAGDASRGGVGMPGRLGRDAPGAYANPGGQGLAASFAQPGGIEAWRNRKSGGGS